MNEMMSSFGQQARKTQLIIVIRGNLNAPVSVRASRDRLPNKTRQEARKGNRPYREMIERQVTPDLFKALVHSVVAQQISWRPLIPCGAGYAVGFRTLHPAMLPASRFLISKNVAYRCGRHDTSRESLKLRSAVIWIY